MAWVAAPLIGLSLLFGACASDQLAKREFLDPAQDRTDQVVRSAMALCAIGSAFAAGLLL